MSVSEWRNYARNVIADVRRLNDSLFDKVGHENARLVKALEAANGN
jgi:hypothetical protein